MIHIYRNLPDWYNDYKKGIEREEIKKIHPSETSWIKTIFDYEIYNNSSLFFLNKKIKNLIN